MFHISLNVSCRKCEGMPSMRLATPPNSGPCDPDRFVCLSCDNVLLLGHDWVAFGDYPHLTHEQAKTVVNAFDMMISSGDNNED